MATAPESDARFGSSVALRNRWPPVDVRISPLATKLRGAAICREGPEPDVPICFGVPLFTVSKARMCHVMRLM